MSADAERVVLGCAMLRPQALDAVAELNASDFVRDSHRDVFAAIMRLYRSGAFVDAGTVADALGPKVDCIGGKIALMEMSAEVTSTASVGRYVEIVRREAVKRRVEAAGTYIAAHAKSTDDPDALVAEGVKKLEECERSATSDVTIAELLPKQLREWEKPVETVLLEEWGFRPGFGEFWIIGARPKVGKSAFLLNIAEELGTRHLKTKVYSYEMRNDQWLSRFVSMRSGVSHTRILDGLDDSAQRFIESAMEGDWQRFIRLQDCARLRFDGLIADLRRFSRQGGKVALIDYLQLTVPQTYEDVTEASRRLKLVAAETNLLLIVASQLSRKGQKEDGSFRVPTAADLRQSGGLEQDADGVVLLHGYAADDESIRTSLRSGKYLLEYDDASRTSYKRLSHVELTVARNEPPRRVPAWFDGSEMRWSALNQEA